MTEWHVSGYYTMPVEAETQDEAIEKGCDKIGNGWNWNANPVYDEPDRLRSSCDCGFDIVWTPEGWQHDAAPYFWGGDHAVDIEDPDPEHPAVKFWDIKDGVRDE